MFTSNIKGLRSNFKKMSVLVLASLLMSSYTLPTPKAPIVDSPEVTQLHSISKGISAISKKASDGVVFVSISKTINYVDPLEFFFGEQFRDRGGNGNNERPNQEKKSAGVGSGFIVDLDKGYIITNNHVIAGADEISLKLANGSNYLAKVVGQDETTDLALVQINDKKYKRENLTQLSLGDSDSAMVGDLVLALGAPFGLESSISLGIISAKGRGNLDLTRIGNFIQTDAAINPGNSGGPLLDASGHVIGVNTAIYSRSGGYNGIGFAVPSNIVREVVEQLIGKGKVERGFIGVTLQPLDSDLASNFGLPKDSKGCLVAEVSLDSPAQKAGLEPGDIIVSIDGKATPDSNVLINIVGLTKPGKRVDLEYYRDGKKRNTQISLAEYPGAQVAASSKGGVGLEKEYGLMVQELDDNLKKKFYIRSRQGLVVTDVAQGSPANRAQLRVGDLILSVNNRLIKSRAEFQQQLKTSNKSILRVEREGSFFFTALAK